MSDGIVTVRLSQKNAAFLQANLSVLANTTRQAMDRPGIDPERRSMLGSRAFLLEAIEDAVRSAMLEVPLPGSRKAVRSSEIAPRADAQRSSREYGILSAA